MVKLAFFFAGWASAAPDSCLRFVSELVRVKIGGLDADQRAEPVKATLAWEATSGGQKQENSKDFEFGRLKLNDFFGSSSGVLLVVVVFEFSLSLSAGPEIVEIL